MRDDIPQKSLNDERFASATEIAGVLFDAPELDSQWIPGREQLGQNVHFLVADMYPDAESEKWVRGQYYSRRGTVLNISGRIDLLEDSGSVCAISEVKSMAVSVGAIPGEDFPLPKRYQFQAQLYAYIYSKSLKDRQNAKIIVRLIFYNLTDDSIHTIPIGYSKAEVEDSLEEYLDQLNHAAALNSVLMARRRGLADAIEFPYQKYRQGQEEMMAQTEEIISRAENLLWNAPPGFGKTVTMLVPMFRSALKQGGQVFFATAKSGGREPVRKLIEMLIDGHHDLKTMFLYASDELCPEENFPCRNGECQYQRLRPEIWDRIAAPDELTKPSILSLSDFRSAGRSSGYCPVDLARLMVMRADLVVGDYNYVFDPSVKVEPFRGFQTGEPALNWYLLIDEAHNLQTRAGEMFSGLIQRSEVAGALDLLDMEQWRLGDTPSYRHLRDVVVETLATVDSNLSLVSAEQGLTLMEPDESKWSELREDWESILGRFALEAFNRIDPELNGLLNQVFGNVVSMARLVDRDRDRYPFYVNAADEIVGITCLDPAPELSESLTAFQSVAAFSGTFAPLEFFRRSLGFEGRAVHLVENLSTFAAENSRITLVKGIDTRYRKRKNTAPKVATVIRQFCKMREGGYLIVFPSFEYLNLVLSYLGDFDYPVIAQEQGMRGAQLQQLRDDFDDTPGTRLAMIVAGGQFAEGMDYPGDKCVGVVVIGPCIPPPDALRLASKYYWQRQGEDGGQIAYIMPGLQKVVQAVGRMTRSDSDRGVALLIDDRFMEDRFYQLLPEQWRESLRHGNEWELEVEEFWKGVDDAE